MKPNQNGFGNESEQDCFPVHDTDRDRTKEVFDVCGGASRVGRIKASTVVHWGVCDDDVCELVGSRLPNTEDHLDHVSIRRASS